ncbi:MAG TPA: TetR/AcrR family transcriptional regulator [Anaerolineae bacterium]|nr:TetR/AcrR family transcriptional regulator [Anaerolineae bacterium]
MDRRIARTRRYLRQALMTLVQQKPLDDITIQEITDTADTARITFYRHYKDKNELLADCLYQIYEDLKDSLTIPESIPQSQIGSIIQIQTNSWYQYIAANRSLFKTLFTGSMAYTVRQQLRHIITQQTITVIQNTPSLQVHTAPLDIILVYIADTQINLISWWLETDANYSPELLAEMSVRLIESGAFHFLNKKVEPGDISYTPFQMPQ